MKKLLIATTNPGKLKEFTVLLADLPFRLLSLHDVGITDDVEETGKTYEENSQLKALFYAKKSDIPAIADDGGLEIDALDGAPGIKSRRWLGYKATDEQLIEYMKKVAKELPDDKRGAHFKAVVSFALPNGKVWSSFGQVDGIIPEKPSLELSQGYPYRSFFYLPKLKKFYFEKELTEDEQKRYNHRYKAIVKIKAVIKKEV